MIHEQASINNYTEMDERLEPIPLKIQPVKLILRYAGRGEPVLQNDTELILLEGLRD